MSNKVAECRLPHTIISTIWLYGIPHPSFTIPNVPCYYETVLLEDEGWVVVERYPTLAEAQAGHKKWVTKECQRYTGVEELVFRILNWWRNK